MEYLQPNDNVYKNIERFYLPKWKSWLNCLIALFLSNLPLQVAYYKSKKFSAKIKDLSKTHDAIFCHLLRVSEAVKDIDCIKFLEMSDAISMNYSRIANSKYYFYDIRTLIYSLEAKRIKNYEAYISHSYNHSFLVSEVDKDYLVKLNSLNAQLITVSTLGVDTNRLNYKLRNNNGDIAFIGNLNSLQNLDAAYYLVNDIFPLLKLTNPNIRIRLVGRMTKKLKSTFSKIQGVDVYVEVPDIASAIEGCSIGICPIRFGAGIQTKILEYMALGLPTITTSIGLEGLKAVHMEQLIVADSAFDIVKSIELLLINNELYENISSNALNYININHNLPEVLLPISDKIKEILK
jgi:glycosyltransferase involved in cell wall biosynthesis